MHTPVIVTSMHATFFLVYVSSVVGLHHTLHTPVILTSEHITFPSIHARLITNIAAVIVYA